MFRTIYRPEVSSNHKLSRYRKYFVPGSMNIRVVWFSIQQFVVVFNPLWVLYEDFYNKNNNLTLQIKKKLWIRFHKLSIKSEFLFILNPNVNNNNSFKLPYLRYRYIGLHKFYVYITNILFIIFNCIHCISLYL